MPGKDREDAMRQGRSHLNTHENDAAPNTDEAQTRGQRHRTKRDTGRERKGDWGVGE